MERGQIEHFVAIVEHGAFTSAAGAMHISQPALSHSIKMLERDVGAALFHRLPRGVRLTSAGEAFAESARRILREMEAARDAIYDVEGLLGGNLDLRALPGLLLDPLAGLIGRFREQYPAVKVRVQHAQRPADVRDAVRSGAAELGLTDDVEDTGRELCHQLISDQEYLVVLPPNTAVPSDGVLSMPQLLRMDLVTGPVGTEVRDMLARESRRRGSTFTPCVEVGQRGAALYLAIAGAGVAVLPRPLAELGRAHGAVLAHLRPTWWRKTYLLHRDAPLSPSARAMRGVILGGS